MEHICGVLVDSGSIKQFESAIADAGIQPQPEVEVGMRIFHPMLEKWSRRVRLVGSTDPQELAVKHFADSLTLLPFLSGMHDGGSVLDVGSGAGFPGIPLALARPKLAFSLVECDGRKASFMVAAVAGLGLRNVRVIRARAQERRCDESIPACDFVVSRALTDPGRWLPLAKVYTQRGGMVAAMMGAKAPPDDALEELGCKHGFSLFKIWRAEMAGVGKRVVAAWRLNG